MIRINFKNIFRIVLPLTIFLALFIFPSRILGQIYQQLTALQCDSLVMTHENNPNFVILDVRRPSEYNPEHLEGAINRDFYESDFSEQINALNKTKTYMIHCKSGSRSANAFSLMQTLGFPEVYNMKGGINAWKSASLPTTDEFGPKLMFVTDYLFPLKEIAIGDTDTLAIGLTNRANAILIFEAICSLDGMEFQTDFHPDTSLSGADDYTFHIFYTPIDEEPDSLSFCIESNGGNVNVEIYRTGKDNTAESDRPTSQEAFHFYPNPARDYINIEPGLLTSGSFEILDIYGKKIVKEGQLSNLIGYIDLNDLLAGCYVLRIYNENGLNFTGILVVEK